MFQNEQSQVGSYFIGKKIYENTKITEALKMFENSVIEPITVSATQVLPNTNATSLAVDRGAA